MAIIPARGGSKRLDRKNVRPLRGKPLIAWTIEAAVRSQFVDHVLVTSEDDEILSVAEAFGASTLKRPKGLAEDHTSTIEVLKHALRKSAKYDFVVLLQPTSPLRTEEHIDAAIRYLIDKSADAVISVTEMTHSPLWANTLPVDGSMQGFLRSDVQGVRSQDLPSFYRVNGAIYICEVNRFLAERTFFIRDNVYAYRMDRASSVDIDVELDFFWADFLLGKASSEAPSRS